MVSLVHCGSCPDLFPNTPDGQKAMEKLAEEQGIWIDALNIRTRDGSLPVQIAYKWDASSSDSLIVTPTQKFLCGAWQKFYNKHLSFLRENVKHHCLFQWKCTSDICHHRRVFRCPNIDEINDMDSYLRQEFSKVFIFPSFFLSTHRFYMLKKNLLILRVKRTFLRPYHFFFIDVCFFQRMESMCHRNAIWKTWLSTWKIKNVYPTLHNKLQALLSKIHRML